MSHYCGRHDPLVAAGRLACRICGALAYPIDAEWLGDDLVLATFPARCEHGPDAAAYIITPSELAEPSAPFCRVCGEPAGTEAELCPDCRCSAITWTGTRCRNQAVTSGLCRVHLAQRRRQERTSR